MRWTRCPSAGFASVALSPLRESHRLRRGHGSTAVTRIEHCRCFVRWFIGKAMQPATNHITLVLSATSCATGTAWLSDTGPYLSTGITRTKSFKPREEYYLRQLELGGWVNGALRAYLNCKSVMVVAPACFPSPPNRRQSLGKLFLVTSTMWS